ncbi:MAG: hypothetical protein JXB38_17265 [Anaerolineales bacterium]|nr:hypothetical protein [Anaerolineales bacterium]
MGQTSRYILPLDAVTLTDGDRVGNKAAVLGALCQAGLPVPPGFCILQAPEGIDEASFWEEVVRAYRELAPQGELVAVRSSGLNEDLPDASFAGLYKTILSISNFDQLRAAIEECWAGVDAEELQVYLRRQGLDGDALALPLLVQRQVNATKSGVMFTADPSTGDRNVLVVETVPGLGEELLSGRQEPEMLRLAWHSETLSIPDSNILTDSEITDLIALALGVEQLLGPDQDIEWALDGENLYALQSRPITTVPKHIEIEQLWTRANVGEVLPDVATPLTWDVFQATLTQNVSEDASVAEGQGVNRFYGRVYVQVIGMLHRFCYLPYLTPDVVGKVLGLRYPDTVLPYRPVRNLPVMLAKLIFWGDLLGVIDRLSRLVDTYPALPLDEDVPELLRWTAGCFSLHLKVTTYAIGAFAVLERMLYAWAPADTEKLLSDILSTGEELRTSEPGKVLWRVAEIAAEDETLAGLFTNDKSWPAIRVVLLDSEPGARIAAEMDTFFEIHGGRTAGEFELSQPRWGEDPTYALEIIRNNIGVIQAGGISSSRAKPARKFAATGLPSWQRKLVEQAVAKLRAYTVLREEVKYRLITGFAALRQHYLRIGEKLATEQSIPEVADVFFFKRIELRALIEGRGLSSSPLELIAERKAQYNTHSQQHAPELVLSRADSVEQVAEGGLLGIPCSPGVVEGTACVLHDLSELQHFRPGSILVAPHTDPGWTPLFLSCAGLVTEIGGILSHGATVAREYGIPAVVNVRDATQLIQDGDYIRLDGDRGQIVILSSESTEAEEVD